MHKKIFCLETTDFLEKDELDEEFIKELKEFGEVGIVFIFTKEDEYLLEDIIYKKGAIEYVGQICSLKETSKEELISNIISSGKNPSEIYIVGNVDDEKIAKKLKVQYVNPKDYSKEELNEKSGC